MTLAVFWPVTGHDFVNYDDTVYVTANPHVTGGLSWQSIRWAFSNLEAGFWHPLTWLSILADCQFYGLHAWGHHLTSLLLHAAGTVVLFLALQRMTRATWRSALVALLFGLHPLHVESVAWASERKDVLSGLFWMLTLLMYARYAEELSARGQEPDNHPANTEGQDARKNRAVRGDGVSPPATRHPSWYYTLALVCFGCGLMSKPIVVTLPFVLLLLDYWPLQRLSFFPSLHHSSTPPLQPSTTPLLRLIALTVYAEKGVGALAPVASYPLAGRIQNALLSWLWYLGKTIWPTHLAAFYPYPETFPAWHAVGAGLVGLTISALVLRAARKRPYLAVGWLWYVGTLLPVVGLIQVGGFSRADRFTYLPLIGVFLALTWGTYELAKSWRYGVIAWSTAGAVAIVLCVALTRQQLGYWQDSEALFQHALAVTKHNWLAHNNLGDALEKKGQTDEAIRQYQKPSTSKPITPMCITTSPAPS
ncbi:MAG: tetratricopeptide repeat protein [Planctomycetota bacterium]|nr:tetratricopeptide repeat protein [Planctomycetota bacterium]